MFFYFCRANNFETTKTTHDTSLIQVQLEVMLEFLIIVSWLVKQTMIFPYSCNCIIPAELLFNTNACTLGSCCLRRLESSIILQLWKFLRADQVVKMILTCLLFCSCQPHNQLNHLFARHTILCFITELDCVANELLHIFGCNTF
jgi:hypothetical protein